MLYMTYQQFLLVITHNIQYGVQIRIYVSVLHIVCKIDYLQLRLELSVLDTNQILMQ